MIYGLDSAYLHNSIFNLELKRRELEQQNLARIEVNRWFEENYRVFSKKSAFTCLCCNKTVNMNLTKDEGRPFYFRHNDESECSYSTNTSTYENHISKHEVKSKKDIGLTIFKEILEGELKPYNVEIERGYLYKKKLSFIPDFIIKFPNSEQRWAIDYFTAMNQGLTSGSYARHLAKRMKTYGEEGFKSFSFVDSSWLSFLEETNKGTLLTAETYVTSKAHEDNLWDTFLQQNIHGDLLDFFMKDIGLATSEFTTRNIAYVDVFKRFCTIFRFISTSKHDRTITFYKLSSSEVPLTQALSVNADQNHFVLSNENEDEKRNDFLKELIERKQQVEIEKQMAQMKAQKLERQKIIQIATMLEDDEETVIEMQERMRLASLRPINVHPKNWDPRSKIKTKSENYIYQQFTAETRYAILEDPVEKKIKEKVREILLSQPIKGELYISGDTHYWRKVILKWIKDHQSGNSLVVPLDKIIDYMKSAGISFNQNDSLVTYPIKEFLEFYKKTLKVELKKKIELIIQE